MKRRELFKILPDSPSPCVWWESSWDSREWRFYIMIMMKRSVISFGKETLFKVDISSKESNGDNCACGQMDKELLFGWEPTRVSDLGPKLPGKPGQWSRLKRQLPLILTLLPGAAGASEKASFSAAGASFPQLIGVQSEALREVVRLTLTLSAPVKAVETHFASPGRFVVRISAGLDKSLPKRLGIAKGAVAEVALDSFEKDPCRTQVALILNTPVPCRAEAQPKAQKVVIEAQNPAPKPPVTFSRPPVQELTLDFAGAELRDIFQGLALQSGRNIAIGPGVQGQATVHLRQVTLEKALDILCQLHNLDYWEKDGIFLIGTVEEIERLRAAERRVEMCQVEEGDLQWIADLLTKAWPKLEVKSQEPHTLILIGFEEDLSGARTLLNSLPLKAQRTVQGTRSVELLEVHKANPVQVHGLLSKLFPQVNFQVQEGLSALAALGSPEDIAEARRLLIQLDEVSSPTVPSSEPMSSLGEVTRTEACQLQSVDLEETRQLLAGIWPHLKLSTLPAWRILILTGLPEDVQGARKLLEQLDTGSHRLVGNRPETSP